MCWQCDHPGSTWLDYLDHLRGLAGQHGWAVQTVDRSGARPPWAYTVGLTQYGKPELIVTGLPVLQAGALADDIAGHLMHAAAPAPGEQTTLADGLVIEIVRVDTPSAHSPVATQLYGPRVRALQVVHADDRGHWPWDAGYRGVQGGQPVLGRRSPSAGRVA